MEEPYAGNPPVRICAGISRNFSEMTALFYGDNLTLRACHAPKKTRTGVRRDEPAERSR